ncbi:hypothetical protein DCAR_0102437 [Daucus carota subsp. sativus]|uniref:Major facilitator superfamily (MFS) profile domain-containing protein n=1 Tax=Daucus carota subsp. sativus TaxID=79200 RepID=A0AAF0W590_DAUCS|nr:hypothetical protein DCAR_0102437 [Daucus carota subsp. sativus]
MFLIRILQQYHHPRNYNISTSNITKYRWSKSGLLEKKPVRSLRISTFCFPKYPIFNLFAGVGIRFGVMIAPVYMCEIAPAVARSSLTSFLEIFYKFGNLSWVMIVVRILPSTIIGCALFFIPESPTWLVMKHLIDDARLVLLKTIESEREATGHGNAEQYEEKAVWRDCYILTLEF